jgi:hypothetical protein
LRPGDQLHRAALRSGPLLHSARLRVACRLERGGKRGRELLCHWLLTRRLLGQGLLRHWLLLCLRSCLRLRGGQLRPARRLHRGRWQRGNASRALRAACRRLRRPGPGQLCGRTLLRAAALRGRQQGRRKLLAGGKRLARRVLLVPWVLLAGGILLVPWVGILLVPWVLLASGILLTSRVLLGGRVLLVPWVLLAGRVLLTSRELLTGGELLVVSELLARPWRTGGAGLARTT